MNGFSDSSTGGGGGALPGPPLRSIISSSRNSCSAAAISSTAEVTQLLINARIKSLSISSSNAPPCPHWNSSPSTSFFFLKRYWILVSSSFDLLYLEIFSSRFEAASNASSGDLSNALQSSAW